MFSGPEGGFGLQVGMVMSIGPIISALTGIMAGSLVDRFGPGRAVMAGLVAMTAGALGLAILPEMLGVGGYIIALVVLTPGYQLFQAANTTAVMTGAPADQRGAVSGLLNLARNLGLISGTAVMGAVFAMAAGTNDLASAPPEAVANGLRVTFLTSSGLIMAMLALTARTRLFTARRDSFK